MACTGKLLQILHRAVARVDGTVVGHIIAVVALGRGEERRQLEIVNAQVGEVVQFRGDALQIAEAVTVRVHEGFRVNLVDNLVLEIVHCKPHLHSEPNQATPFFLPMATVSTKGTTIAINMHSAKLSI